MEITGNRQDITRKSIAFDTKSNGNYKKSTTIHEEIAGKSIVFDEKSIAVDTKSNEVAEIPQDITMKST